MITLYGKRTSINVRKVLWLLKILDIEYSYIDTISISEIKLMNPNGLVPILKDDEFILWESNSILRYITNKFNLNDYYPNSPKKRAQVDKWLDWQASDFNSSWVYAFQSIVRKSEEHTDKKLIESSINNWNNCISILNNQLKKSNYIAGDTFTIADIVIAVSLNRWYLSIGEKNLFKHVDLYYDRLSILIGFKEIIDNGTP
ncbi:Glutathione S-transferase domain protein [Arcobacter nitrofigilis DSM 7299]|uniref:Glutathione S-transferase domain protein n=1 Tax=Arcobacter nitrofigilis (strain ATCC 33309 / DSM 7299 / CCUG 15893 / LMG 7604 / NCTC 12251 / CI) TaxID=572480 RepID=D5V1B6_ARCNC|nr:glutathione S-transferase N-terminal domain-containing protein [Arcobacter nitrofigilis]ADG94078.1 Glutathione S-transferase domain protein [Arcobacter nitrofigilis DSM 7299]